MAGLAKISSVGPELDDTAEEHHPDAIGELATTLRSWVMNR